MYSYKPYPATDIWFLCAQNVIPKISASPVCHILPAVSAHVIFCLEHCSDPFCNGLGQISAYHPSRGIILTSAKLV